MLAIVPVKGLDGAKSRLTPLLDADERARLAVEMLDRVLAACAGASAIAETLLVTPEPALARAGVDLFLDGGAGHAEALAAALADPRARDGALVVMADCPLATADALDALAEAARPLALAPARDGGVNALALRAAAGFRPDFGVPAEETIARAQAVGIEPTVLHDERLSFDVDLPEDYELLLARA